MISPSTVDSLVPARIEPGRRGRSGLVAVLVICGLWIAARAVFIAQSTAELQLVVMALFLVYACTAIASAIAVAIRWRASGWRSARPLLACVAAWWVSGWVGDAARYGVFVHDLPAFEAIAARPEVRGLAPGADLDVALNEPEKSVALHAAAERAPDGTLLVEVVTGVGFPVKHSGFLFSSTGRIPTDSHMHERWPCRGTMREHWFSVSD